MDFSMPRPNVVAVIVTYNPDHDFRARLADHAKEIERLIVVDNSTDPRAIELVRSAVSSIPFCEIISHNDNPGLAKAQNAGIKRAMALGPEWTMLLDDDSRMDPGMVSAMLEALAHYPEPERVGLLAPRVVDERSGLESKVLVSRGPFDVRRVRFGHSAWIDSALTAIASGSMIRAQALNACGPMREDYFIDGIDIEYCLRLRRNGWRLLMVREARLHHRLGMKTRHTLAGMAFIASNHSALRRYTIMRNRMANWKQYAREVPGYVANDIAVSLFEAIKILLFESQKKEKFRAIYSGLIDGLRGHFPKPAAAILFSQTST